MAAGAEPQRPEKARNTPSAVMLISARRGGLLSEVRIIQEAEDSEEARPYAAGITYEARLDTKPR